MTFIKNNHLKNTWRCWAGDDMQHNIVTGTKGDCVYDEVLGLNAMVAAQSASLGP